MHRIASPRAAQRLIASSAPSSPLRASTSRRFASTYSSSQSRSWKSSTARWALAFGAVYFYTSTPAFAESRDVNDHPGSLPMQPGINKNVTAIHEERHEAKAANAANKKTPLRSSLGHRSSANDSEPEQPGPTSSSSKASGATAGKAPSNDPSTSSTSKPSSGEGSDASSHNTGGQGSESPDSDSDSDPEDPNAGAYNPETGEINWDCPCLGGMAHGPCGEEFRAAFSCFVHSTEEPKGVECIDRFKGMQDCFQAHPEVYGDELEEADKHADRELAAEREIAEAAKKAGGVEGGEGLEKGLAAGGERVLGKDGEMKEEDMNK